MEEGKKTRWLKISVSLLLAILLFVGSIAMTGLFGLVDGTFNPNAWSDPTFQAKVSIAALINFTAMLSIITYWLPEQPKRNKDVQTRNKTMEEFNATTRHDLIEEWVIEENIDRKKRVYLSHLERDRKRFIKRYKPSLEDKRVWHKGTLEEKGNNEYCLKMMEFDSQRSDEYIKDNLLYMDIKYPEITSAMVLSANMSTSYGLNYVHGNFEKTVWWVINLLMRYMSSIALPAIWAAIIIGGLKEPTVEFWLDFIARVIGMIIAMGSGVWLVETFTKIFTLPDLDFRIALGRRYGIWLAKKVNK